MKGALAEQNHALPATEGLFIPAGRLCGRENAVRARGWAWRHMRVWAKHAPWLNPEPGEEWRPEILKDALETSHPRAGPRKRPAVGSSV